MPLDLLKEPEIFQAIARRDLEALQLLNTDVNHPASDGTTPLMFAVQTAAELPKYKSIPAPHCHFSDEPKDPIIALLLTMGANINATRPDGVTALYLAVTADSEKQMALSIHRAWVVNQLLVTKNITNLNVSHVSDPGKTAFWWLAARASDYTTRYLLSWFIQHSANVNAKPLTGEYAGIPAIGMLCAPARMDGRRRYDDPDLFVDIIASGANLDLTNTHSKSTLTLYGRPTNLIGERSQHVLYVANCLFDFARTSELRGVSVSLERMLKDSISQGYKDCGAHISQSDKHGNTLLHLAFQYSQIKAAIAFIEIISKLPAGEQWSLLWARNSDNHTPLDVIAAKTINPTLINTEQHLLNLKLRTLLMTLFQHNMDRFVYRLQQHLALFNVISSGSVAEKLIPKSLAFLIATFSMTHGSFEHFATSPEGKRLIGVSYNKAITSIAIKKAVLRVVDESFSASALSHLTIEPMRQRVATQSIPPELSSRFLADYREKLVEAQRLEKENLEKQVADTKTLDGVCKQLVRFSHFKITGLSSHMPTSSLTSSGSLSSTATGSSSDSSSSSCRRPL